MTKLGLLLILAGVACRSKEPPSSDDRVASQVAVGGSAGTAARQVEPAAPAPGEPGGTAAVDKAGQNMTGLRPHLGANCPSQLPGATTRLVMTPRGVDVSVTSKDAGVARRIVELARLDVGGRTAEVSRPHDQKHGGPGTIGYCPIVVTSQTAVTMTPMSDGATLHVDARSPGQVTELQQMIKTRALRLPGYLSS